jgi:hypothetical protein
MQRRLNGERLTQVMDGRADKPATVAAVSEGDRALKPLFPELAQLAKSKAREADTVPLSPFGLAADTAIKGDGLDACSMGVSSWRGATNHGTTPSSAIMSSGRGRRSWPRFSALASRHPFIGFGITLILLVVMI